MRVESNEEIRFINFRSNGANNENDGIKIVITGFGPFRDHLVNASWEAVKKIPEFGISLPPNINPSTGLEIIVYEVPVIYKVVSDLIPKIWEKHNPDLVIHVGVSGIARAIPLEQFAHNFGYCSPDIKDSIPSENTCIGDGCEILESGLGKYHIIRKALETIISRQGMDMSKVVSKLNSFKSSARINAEVSYDPGRYLCDYTYYNSLSVDKERTAFIHVPPLGKPWDSEDLSLAISLCKDKSKKF